MGTKGKLLIIALLMSGIVSLLVWSKNGTPKKTGPAVGSTNTGAVDEAPAADDPNARPGPDSGDRYHLPQEDPSSGDGSLRVETADNGSRTPPVVNLDSHPDVARPEPPATAARTYKVEAGDSLAKIATKIYGRELAWKLIYEANKDKMSSPDDLLRVGTALVIPAGAPENRPPANDTVTAPKKVDPPKDVVKNDPPKETPKVEGARKSYKVKAGDTLSSIAKAVLGDSNKWKAIYLANKEKLPHPDTLIEGMELSIP